MTFKDFYDALTKYDAPYPNGPVRRARSGSDDPVRKAAQEVPTRRRWVTREAAERIKPGEGLQSPGLWTKYLDERDKGKAEAAKLAAIYMKRPLGAIPSMKSTPSQGMPGGWDVRSLEDEWPHNAPFVGTWRDMGGAGLVGLMALRQRLGLPQE